MTRTVDNLDFLLGDFARRCAPHVQHAVAVSSDGILVAATHHLPGTRPTSSPRSRPA